MRIAALVGIAGALNAGGVISIGAPQSVSRAAAQLRSLQQQTVHTVGCERALLDDRVTDDADIERLCPSTAGEGPDLEEAVAGP